MTDDDDDDAAAAAAVHSLLIVVGIIEGRYFFKRPHYHIISEAKFNGERLTTDPVDHECSPNFNTELAWPLDQKSFHQHKLQRTPIKLILNSIGPNGESESIGYVMIYLRSLSVNNTILKPTWFPLLGATRKYRDRPEVCISLKLEDQKDIERKDIHEDVTGGFEVGDTVKAVDDESMYIQLTKTDPHSQLLVQLVDNDYYQIGNGDSIYLLSVSIAFASNLNRLVSAATNAGLYERAEEKNLNGFYFGYSLLGNDFASERFYSAEEPEFTGERATIRLRCSSLDLSAFLRSQPALRVYLCHGHIPIGCTEARIADLVTEHRTFQSVDGTFFFGSVAAGETGHKFNRQDSDSFAFVTISLNVCLEGHSNSTNIVDDLQEKLDDFSLLPPDSPVSSSSHHMEREPQPGTTQFLSPHSLIPVANGSKSQSRIYSEPPTGASSSLATLTKVAESSSRRSNDLRLYRFSVDLRSIRAVRQAASNIYLRYTYPYFGSPAPVMTAPPIRTTRLTEHSLPSPFHTFTFMATPSELRECLTNAPLTLEMWDRDAYMRDFLAGVAKIDLSKVLSANAISRRDFKGATLKAYDCDVKVVAFDSNGLISSEAEVRVVLSLEDAGPKNSPHQRNGGSTIPKERAKIARLANQGDDSSSVDVNRLVLPPPLVSAGTAETDHREAFSHTLRNIQLKPKPASPTPKLRSSEEGIVSSGSGIRQGAEYALALDLELWKREEETRFQATLREKEQTLLQRLADEWKRRDKERETLLNKKIGSYNVLEGQLKTSLYDLEGRDRKLVLGEEELRRRLESLQRNHASQLEELREASRRVQEDADHQVNIAENKVSALTQEKTDLEARFMEERNRLRAIEAEFSEFKSATISKPESRLRAELADALVERSGLEKKVEAAEAAKRRYKTQWTRALQEVARLKQAMASQERARLIKDQRELEHMRLRYLASEEKDLVKNEKQELESLKAELMTLRAQQLDRGTSENIATSGEGLKNPYTAEFSVGGARMQASKEGGLDDAELRRLMDERDGLLKTGVYTPRDRIIVELDRQIAQRQRHRGNLL